jgi:cytosine/adenosine deaminase-related metal-dependent hydrolase
MITTHAFRAMGLDIALRVGAPAHLVVLDAPTVREAFRNHDAPRLVISHGHVITPERIAALDIPEK